MDRLGRRVTGMLTANLLCVAAILFQVGAYLSDRYELYMVIAGGSGKCADWYLLDTLSTHHCFVLITFTPIKTMKHEIHIRLFSHSTPAGQFLHHHHHCTLLASQRGAVSLMQFLSAPRGWVEKERYHR
jgi:hypothetical protein